ncbi:hypothetical protein Tco_1425266, partial [Tanacetum coccineum]
MPTLNQLIRHGREEKRCMDHTRASVGSSIRDDLLNASAVQSSAIDGLVVAYGLLTCLRMLLRAGVLLSMRARITLEVLDFTDRCMSQNLFRLLIERSEIKVYEKVGEVSPKEPTLKGCKQRKVLTLSPTLFSDDVPWAKGFSHPTENY